MTKRVFLLVAVLLACAVQVSSQTFPIKIHGHPQCSMYVADDTPIDPGVTCHLPSLPSAQCDVMPADLTVPGQPGGMLGHTHGELIKPFPYGEVSTPFTVEVQTQRFMEHAHISRVEGAYLRSVVWDAPFTDATGAIITKGRATFDPTVPDASGNIVPPKGWYHPNLTIVTAFDNGLFSKSEFIWPLYSMRDPLAEETPSNFQLESRCTGFPVEVWGTNSIGFRNVFPPILAPITSVWEGPVLAYGYGSQRALPVGTFDQRLDMNRHAGIPGTLLASEQSFGGNPNGNMIRFDPAVIGPGAHKMAFGWDQTTGAGGPGFLPNQEVTAWLVLPFTVGDVITTPPVDVCPNLSGVQAVVPAGMQLVNGQCVAQPPVLTWQPNTLQPERNGDLERLCAADGKCIVLGTLVTP